MRIPRRRRGALSARSAGAGLLALVALLAVPACGGGEPPGPAPPAAGEPAPPPAAAEETPPATGVTDAANQVEVTLYFLAADGEMLAPEKRRIFRTTTVTDRARQTVQALLDGPEGPLQRALPPGTKLNEIFVARDGTAYVDLSPEFRRGIETGTSDGVSAIYSIVNTLTDNFDEIARVKILLDGQEVEDIGGHFDLSRPILPEMSQVDRH